MVPKPGSFKEDSENSGSKIMILRRIYWKTGFKPEEDIEKLVPKPGSFKEDSENSGSSVMALWST